jgi:gliding motility-associated protein GldC
MKKEIKINVELDENNIPEKINWSAESMAEETTAKAMLLSLWDEKEQNTFKIDLWTKDMTVEEMKKFFFQTFITMADSLERSTGEDGLADALRDFADFFGEKLGIIPKTGKFEAK